MKPDVQRILAESQKKAEDRPFSKRTAIEALYAAFNDPKLTEHAAFFLGRCSVSEVLTPNELEDAKRRLTQRVKEGHAEEDKAVTQFKNGAQKPIKIIDYSTRFRSVDDLEKGELKMYIDGVLPEGITFLGSLSGVGKTLLALSMARALQTFTNFLGVYPVLEKTNVIYLVPEMGDRAFRARCEKFGLNKPEFRRSFLCQTMNDPRMPLADPHLEIAIKELNPVVFLDTAIRFNDAEDENAAKQNKGLSDDIFQLMKWGAKAAVVLHHSPKKQGEAWYMTLENVLRGTGDLGAMCDAVWGLEHDRGGPKERKDKAGTYLKQSKDLTRVRVECVKPRDFEPVRPFRVQGRYVDDKGVPHSYIDEKGDLTVLVDGDARIDQILAANPKLTTRELAAKLGTTNHTWAGKQAAEAGWQKTNGIWRRVAEAAPAEAGEPEPDLPFDQEQDGAVAAD